MNREFAQGMSKVKENDFLSAIEFFSLSIESAPNYVEAYAERAVAYLNTDQFELSMFDMNKCIEFEPNNSYRYSCRAFLKSKMGDVEGAIADYEMAVKLDPEDAIAYNNLGLAQESKGHYKKAQKSFDQSNKLIGYNPKRFDEEIPKEKPELNDLPIEEQKSKQRIIKSVITTKSGFKEFILFIKNGFKIKE